MSISGNILSAAVAVLVFSACAGDPEPPAGQAAADEQAADAEHVWKEQVETIDRAREVEQTLKDADAAKRKAIKEAGGG